MWYSSLTKSFSVLMLAYIALRMDPYRALNIPYVGWIFGVIGGLEFPPMFETVKLFKQQEKWLKSGAVVISSGSKTGTTWMMATIEALRAKGDSGYTDISLVVPFVELLTYPRETVEERITRFGEHQKKYSLQVFKTHFGPPKMLFRKDVRYIIPVRDVLSAASSFKDMARGMQLTFREDWGGFPPPFPDFILQPMLLQMIDDLFVTHLEGWLKYRNESNVWFVHYDDRRKLNPIEDARIIAKKIGIEVTDEELKRAVDASSFEFMKKNKKRYDFCTLYDKARAEGKISKNVDCMLNGLVNKGGIRTPKVELDPEFQKQVIDLAERRLGKNIVKWLETGGDMPVT